MRELIDRDAALSCFHDYIDKHGDIYPAADCPEYRAIEALPAVPGTEWIPCDERMPEKKREYVLVTVMDNTPRKESERYFVDIASLINGHIWFPDSADWSSIIGESGKEYTVLAWAPLPEPYKPSC